MPIKYKAKVYNKTKNKRKAIKINEK